MVGLQQVKAADHPVQIAARTRGKTEFLRHVVHERIPRLHVVEKPQVRHVPTRTVFLLVVV